MEISQQYIAALITIIVAVLNLFNLKYDLDSLTQVVGSAVILISGLWIMYRRYKQGDINIAGLKVKKP